MSYAAKKGTDRDRAPRPAVRAGFGVAVAVVIAVVFGFAFDNAAIGIALGLVFGGVGGAGLGELTRSIRRRPDDRDNDAE